MSLGTNIYKWKRFQSPQQQSLKKQKKDDIKNWLEKVEAATDSALKNAFDHSDDQVASRRPNRRAGRFAEDDIIRFVGDIHDNEAAHAEAKEIVTDWISDKIRYDFLDDENDNCAGGYQTDESGNHTNKLSCGIETASQEKWYEDSDTFLQKYLNSGNNAAHKNSTDGQAYGNDVLGQFDVYDGDEEAVVNALMKKMMETETIKHSDMKVLREKGNLAGHGKPTVRPRDPKTSMDIRHKEVREARLRRQKEEEKRKLDKLIQKEAKLQAQKILKDEELKKKLKQKQEEDAIQIEMAKIRKEMIAQRNLEEKRRQEYELGQQKALQELSCEIEIEQEEEKLQDDRSEDDLAEEKRKKLSLILKMRNADNRRTMQSCFSTWCKLVLQQRVKLGKAKALADWKSLQKSWAGWKSYITNLRLDRETEHHQASIRDMRIKEKKAIQSARVKLLRKMFIVWKVWVKAEQERKEILEQQQNTKAKMQALLNAVATSNKEDDVKCSEPNDQSESPSSPHSSTSVRKQSGNRKTSKSSTGASSKQGMPRHAWQVKKKDVQNLQPEDMMRIPTSTQVSERYSRANAAHLYDPYENRHKFQKELIEQQRALLQEQKKMIKDIQEQQSLTALHKEIAELKEQKMALDINSSEVSKRKKVATNAPIPARSDTTDGPSSARSLSAKKHPIVEKMEKRALERAERKKELEEMRRKKEDEKRKRLQEEEDRKLREEEEKKRTEILERKEARRLQQKIEEEKKAAQDRMRTLCKLSVEHHTRNLMKFHGFRPWYKLVNDAKEKLQVAKFHANQKLLRTTISEWRDVTQRITDERNEMADRLYKILLLRRGVARWKKYGERMDILEQKAKLHHNRVLKKNFLRYWIDYTTDERFNQWRNESRADQHNHTRLLRRVFNVIRSYRKLVKMETERRQRIDELRRKVTRLLPDFHYSQDSFLSDNFGDDDGVE